MGRFKLHGCIVTAALLLVSAQSSLFAQSQEELARAAQNPVASMISLPFQNNTNFGYGPDDDIQNVLNIQPVWPFSLSRSWNLISRTILPVVYQPDLPEMEGGFGLGDLNGTLFFSPARPGKVIWGVGPTLTLPSATSSVLGSEKWAGGLGVVALTMPGRWVVGALVNQQWSFAGDDQRDDVNAMLLQYFVNYNFKGGWYFTSAPVNTVNWNVDSDDRFVVPLGGGFGRIIPGKPPLNVSLTAYYNVVKPDNLPAGDWTLRLQFQLMFPRS
jgi:hypothetical protein